MLLEFCLVGGLLPCLRTEDWQLLELKHSEQCIATSLTEPLSSDARSSWLGVVFMVALNDSSLPSQ